MSASHAKPLAGALPSWWGPCDCTNCALDAPCGRVPLTPAEEAELRVAADFLARNTQMHTESCPGNAIGCRGECVEESK